ncbi:cation:proton antiporter [Pontibacter sp. CAU 1760]
MNDYIVAMAVIGFAALSMAWVPTLMERTFISYPIVFLLLGMMIYLLPLGLPYPDPLWQETYVVRLTELSVIISLMGTGLKLRRKISWRNWQIPLRLVSITMLLCIGIMAVLGWQVLGMTLAGGVLLGAALAPTDPVLAEQVQVGPPHEKEEDDVRFSLTAEAGLNDGTAFPFTWLAVVLTVAANTDSSWFSDWLIRDLLYRIIVGVASGAFIGLALGYLVFNLPAKTRFPKARDGFLALSATLVSYSVTELFHGYGFIAVFVTGLTLSSFEEENDYHTEMHDFVNQIERIIMVTLLIVFGGSLVTGLLDHLTWKGMLVGLGFLFFIRPVTALLGLIGIKNCSWRERLSISFFGIRGIGSFFYLAFALEQVGFADGEQLWSVVGFIVMVSIMLHGLTASWVMDYLDSSRRAGKIKDTTVPENYSIGTGDR